MLAIGSTIWKIVCVTAITCLILPGSTDEQPTGMRLDSKEGFAPAGRLVQSY